MQENISELQWKLQTFQNNSPEKIISYIIYSLNINAKNYG